MPRLPCLATGTPAAAVTMAAAVEILKVFEPSPPVPQVSISPERRVRMGVIFFRMAEAAPATSSTVSPFSCKAVKQPGDFLLRAMPLHDLPEGIGHQLHREILAGFDEFQR